MQLIEALRLDRNARAALVGGGGKTTALFQLARELLSQSESVLVTTTTHLGSWQSAQADHHFILLAAASYLPTHLPPGVLLFSGPPSGEERLSGLDKAAIQALFTLAEAHRLPLLVEADGSRRLPLKAPAAHEPVIPGWANTVVVTVGMSGLGQPLNADWVQRPEIFARLAGLPTGEAISIEALARVLCHPQGGLKGIPPAARRIVLLNQADTPERQAAAGRLAQHLLAPGLPPSNSQAAAEAAPAYHAAIVTALAPPENTATGGPPPGVLAVHEPVAGIILAGGASSRLGQPKQLLDWRGQPFVRAIAQTALRAWLLPVVLVSGAGHEAVEAAVRDLPIIIAHNPDWQEGQSASIRRGLAALPAETGAALFLLADQPQITAALLASLVESHAHSLAAIIAPLIDGQRANPVLFDRRTFPDLFSLHGDTGGRAIFSRYPVAWLPWHDASLLLDVDRMEDYSRLIEEEM